MKGAGIVQFTISTPIQMVAGEGLVLACGLRQGAALGCHWHPIHSRILQVLLRTRDIKTPHRVAGRFYMVAGGRNRLYTLFLRMLDVYAH